MIQVADLIGKFQYALDNNFGYVWGTAGILWTEAKQKAATREQTVKYGKQWIGHYVADCSGLFTWAFKELGGTMYHGSNTMYKSYCVSKGSLLKGKRTDGNELRPGTAVFVWSDDSQTYSHVGLYIGNGEVIEAASTQKGVIKSEASNKKWEFWGELKGVNYGEAPAPDPTYRPTLRRGDTGVYVTLMQTELYQRGYDLGSYGIDGNFGKQTENAVKAFQKDNGLTVDGICGSKTWNALESEPQVLYTVTIPHLAKYQAEALVNQYTGAVMTEERG